MKSILKTILKTILNREAISSTIEVAGFVLIAKAAFTVAEALGLVISGLLLVLIGFTVGGSKRRAEG